MKKLLCGFLLLVSALAHSADVKDNSQASTYSYEVLTSAILSANFITQANAEGARGYGYKNDDCFNTTCTDRRSIYVKDNSQASTYSYEALTSAILSTNFIT
jgi:hypothetical protein